MLLDQRNKPDHPVESKPYFFFIHLFPVLDHVLQSKIIILAVSIDDLIDHAQIFDFGSSVEDGGEILLGLGMGGGVFE